MKSKFLIEEKKNSKNKRFKQKTSFKKIILKKFMNKICYNIN